ncbi:hypothetical protein MASR2M18_13960 [Ignavibacteria bacterium]|nr:TonB-dependent receptor [Bacteroidota bacterium]MCZ2133208.1 TonB-dependent receptor [Bacteroidota bacterium]
MKKNLLLLLLGLLLLPIPALAGIYGTLAGRVVDNDGKPLVGATVRVEGTTRGAKTKADGKYTVININPGTYTVSVTFVGFKKFVKERVVISADLTTDLNAKMSPDTKTTDEVIVTAKQENKMVDDKVVGTNRNIQSDDITKVARDNVQSVVTLAAGVQSDASGFVVRGARSNQTQIRVDGLDVGDQFTGGFGTAGATYSPTVSSFAVEEVQVLTGAFSAEYGNALGGVVNTVVKSGRIDTYEGMLRYSTDLPSLFGKSDNGFKLQGKNQNQFDINLGGPIPLLSGATFFIAGKYAHEEFRSNRLGVLDPQGNNLGQIPNQQSWVQNLNGKLKFSMDAITLYVGGSFGVSAVEAGSWDWLYAKDVAVKNLRNENGRIVGDTLPIPEGRAKSPVYNQSINSIYARINHILNDNMSYEFTASLNSNITRNGKRNSYDDPSFMSMIPIYEPIDELTTEGTAGKLALQPGKDKTIDVFQSFPADQMSSDGARSLNYNLRNSLTGYIENGEDARGTMNAYGLSGYFNQHGNERVLDFRSQNYWQFDGFFNAQNIQTGEANHNFKAGFELRLYENRRHYNSLPWDANGFFDIYTDEFGGNIYADSANVYNATSKPKKPMSASLYAQDQITYRGIIINPGIRFDYFDANSAYRLSDMPFSSIKNVSTFPDATAKAQISPRISIAYPITERSNMSISYGVYFQMPQMNYLYDAFNTDVLRGNQILGNPNLSAQRTNQYQVSYNSQFTDEFALGVVAYYKDSYNLVGTSYIASTERPYYQYVVAEYATSRGLEFSLDRRPTPNDHFYANINYTLSFSNTSASSAESNYNPEYDPYVKRNVLPLAEFPFSSDRRHYVKAVYGFSWNRDEGPAIGGIKFLENTSINFVTEYRTGTPFTLLNAKGAIVGEINGNRYPSYTVTDLRLQKTIYLNDIFGDGAGKTALEIFIDVKNLLNRTSAVLVYQRSNDPDYDNNALNRQPGDFSSITWVKEASPTDASSTNTGQYDLSGNRLYNTQADFNKDGQVTQQEKYQSYLNYVQNVVQLRGNYQTPRQVYIGAMFRF